MPIRRHHPLTRLAALAAGIGLVLAAAGCGGEDTPAPSPTPVATDPGNVAIFTPAEGVNLSQRAPLNTWAKLTSKLTAALKDQGVESKRISTSTAESLDEQSGDVQDYVVDMIAKARDASAKDSGEAADSNSDSAKTGDGERQSLSKVTLVIAPVTERDWASKQYGDLVSQRIDPDAIASSAETGDDEKAIEQAATIRRAAERLSSAVKLARESGMHVVLLGNEVKGMPVDAFVQLSTAEDIGRAQAEHMVSKLQLDKTSRDNPKAIEIMLPVSEGDDQSEAFARGAFAGAWKVLQPYFADGRAVSPSGLLDKDSTANDWRNVAFEGHKDEQVTQELDRRLKPDTKTNTENGTDADSTESTGTDDPNTSAESDANAPDTAGDATDRTADGADGDTTDHPAKVDGIIAMNDFLASAVTTELTKLGYTGSAADINPTITISGIVGNIAGKKDLKRSPVPDPIKSPEKDEADGGPATDTDGDGDGATAAEDQWKRWPLVTGFGGYVDVMPQIVDGKQWMTALEDRQSLASDIADAAVRLNRGRKLADMERLKRTTVGGVKTPTLTRPLLAVSASNLKETLIDPGYITLADAGL